MAKSLNVKYREEIEQLQVQLAGCLCAAEGHCDCKKWSYGWSPAYQAVANLRSLVNVLENWLARGVGGARFAFLRKRLERYYSCFNTDNWEKCYRFVDPELRKAGKVSLASLRESLERLKGLFGPVEQIRILELTAVNSSKAKDAREFVRATVLWKNKDGQYHLLCERWVKDCGKWFTREVGPVISKSSKL